MNKDKVGILILNWNGYDLTKECLDSLKDLTYANYEIILLDNGSKDGSGNRLKKEYPGVIHLSSDKNHGFAQGCNICAEEAFKRGADAIWLLNNDTVVEKDSLGELMRAATSKKDVGAAGSMIYYHKTDKMIWFFGAEISWGHSMRFVSPYGIRERDRGEFNIRETDYLSGCSMLIKKQAWEKVGGLDPEYFSYGEEIDWCVRAGKAGYKMLSVPSSIVWHKVSFSTGGEGSPLSSYYIARNNMRMISRHYKGAAKLFLYETIQYIKHLSGAAASLIMMRSPRPSLYAIKGLNDYNRGVFYEYRLDRARE